VRKPTTSAAKKLSTTKKVAVTQRQRTLKEGYPENTVKWKKYLRDKLWNVGSNFHTMSIKEMHASDGHFNAYH